jgi:gamma-glutamylcyclotransferase
MGAGRGAVNLGRWLNRGHAALTYGAVVPPVLRRLRRLLRRAIARSWHLSRLWYRRHGAELVGRPGDEVWYFAYGSNMHHSAFRERRGMRPSEVRVGRIRGYRLRFNLAGRPAGKSAPANICIDPKAEVWGVLYKLTRRDLVRLDWTEGVPGRGYKHLWIEAEDRDGRRVPIVTYMAAGRPQDGRPSLRYIGLLRDGARAHGLPDPWIAMLDQVQPAE